MTELFILIQHHLVRIMLIPFKAIQMSHYWLDAFTFQNNKFTCADWNKCKQYTERFPISGQLSRVELRRDFCFDPAIILRAL